MAATRQLRRTLSPLEPLLGRVESATGLDGPAQAIGKRARAALGGGPVKDALSGTWLGHALHPALTDVVIGSFFSATLLDLIGGRDSDTASRRLIATGMLAYAPTALTGLNDWADAEPTSDAVRRTGAVHAATNGLALTLYAGSLLARRRGRPGRGRVLGAAGALALSAGSLLGGHLTYTQGVGPDQTVFDPGPKDWTDAGDAGSLQPGTLLAATAGDTPLVLHMEGERVFALHDRCSHRGCSLSEGALEGEEIVCPCHGSRFDRRDGAVRHGPATAPQPAFETRVRDGRVEVRRLG